MKNNKFANQKMCECGHVRGLHADGMGQGLGTGYCFHDVDGEVCECMNYAYEAPIMFDVLMVTDMGMPISFQHWDTSWDRVEARVCDTLRKDKATMGLDFIRVFISARYGIEGDWNYMSEYTPEEIMAERSWQRGVTA